MTDDGGADDLDGPIDRWNLGLSILVAVLFGSSWAGGGVPELPGIAVSLLLVVYLAGGAYLPLKRRVPHYDPLFGGPLILYGAHEILTDGATTIGLLFVGAGCLLLASIPFREDSAD